jgi:hypothetical protein
MIWSGIAIIFGCFGLSPLLNSAAEIKGFPDYNPEVYPNPRIDFGICR